MDPFLLANVQNLSPSSFVTIRKRQLTGFDDSTTRVFSNKCSRVVITAGNDYDDLDFGDREVEARRLLVTSMYGCGLPENLDPSSDMHNWGTVSSGVESCSHNAVDLSNTGEFAVQMAMATCSPPNWEGDAPNLSNPTNSGSSEGRSVTRRESGCLVTQIAWDENITNDANGDGPFNVRIQVIDTCGTDFDPSATGTLEYSNQEAFDSKPVGADCSTQEQVIPHNAVQAANGQQDGLGNVADTRVFLSITSCASKEDTEGGDGGNQGDDASALGNPFSWLGVALLLLFQ